MHKNGHFGLSLLLSSPFILVFLLLELYIVSALFLFLILIWSGLPDVDIYLQRYDNVSFSSYPIRYWHWIPVLLLSVIIMNFFGNYINKVPKNYKLESVTHRGLTHSLWFSLAFGLILSILTTIALLVILLIEIYFETDIFMMLNFALDIHYLLLILLMFVIGILSVGFHCAGDVFTPTGIHYLTPRSDYGYTLDQFYAKNEVANRSALPFGVILVSYSVFVGLSFGEINTIYLIGSFILLCILIIPLWVLFVRTGIGKVFYYIYDLFN